MSATTTTNAVPTVNRFFYQATANISTTTFTILASKFSTDAGAAAAKIATLVTSNGYYLLFVNGELQQTTMYSVAAAGASLTIAGTATFTIPRSAVVSIVATNFTPSSTTNVAG